MMRKPRVCVAAIAVTGVVALAGAAQATDHFTCYRVAAARGAAAFAPRDGVQVMDRFRIATVAVRKPQLLCAPASKNGEDPTAPAHLDHLEDYRIRSRGRFLQFLNQTLTDQFGTTCWT